MDPTTPLHIEQQLFADPATALLLQAFRPRTDAAAMASAIHAVTDWESVLDLAKRHRVLPLVARSLRSQDGLPEDIQRSFKARAQRQALRSMHYAGELVRLMQRWRDVGVRALPLKGPALAYTLYGDVAARQFADLDVLVDPEQAGDAVRHLLSSGYHQVAPSRVFAPEELGDVQRRFGLKDLSFYCPARRIALELHWRPFKDPSIRLDFDPSWPSGANWPELDPDALAVYILHHGSNHGYRRLLWLVDAAGLVERHPGIGWDRVRALAKANGLESSVALGLLLAHRLLGTDVPAAFLPVLAQKAPHLRRLADRCLTASPDYVEGGRERLAWMRALDDRPLGRLRHTGRYLLKPSAAEWNDADGRPRTVSLLTRPWSLLKRLTKSQP